MQTYSMKNIIMIKPMSRYFYTSLVIHVYTGGGGNAVFWFWVGGYAVPWGGKAPPWPGNAPPGAGYAPPGAGYVLYVFI